MISKHFNKALIATLSASLLATSAFAVNSENCTTNPVTTLTGQNNVNVDGTNLKRHLQRATNRGRAITLTGTFRIRNDVKVYLNKDLKVTATNAKFVAVGGQNALDGDMFSLDVKDGSSYSKKCQYTVANRRSPDVTWNGGKFLMSGAKVSTVVPYLSKTPAGSRRGSQSSADGLSIRGVNTSQNFSYLRNVIVENIKYYGTPEGSNDVFHKAGGDSGILLIGGAKATIRNNDFYGVRDAAIYVSAQGSTGQYGDNFTMTGNYVERAFDGITSKRGADNIKINDNEFRNVAVPISTKYQTSGRIASNVEVKRNTIYRAIRGISLERAQNATISDNVIREFGRKVADETRPSEYNKFGNYYEGISLLGTQDATVSNNDFFVSSDANGGSNYGSYAITERTVDGRVSKDNTRTGNDVRTGSQHLKGIFKKF